MQFSRSPKVNKSMIKSQRAKLAGTLTLSAILVACLTACTPSKQYDGSKSDGAFFAVPNGWFKISQAELAAEEGKSKDQVDQDRLSMVRYQVGYSATRKISARQVFTLEPTEFPVVFLRIRELFPEERNAVSFNSLRDLIFPITGYESGSATNTRNFQVLDDQEVVERGAKGVNLLYSYDSNGVNTTLNQSTLISNDQKKIFLMIVRCSTKCYQKNTNEINSIVKSFTVRGA